VQAEDVPRIVAELRGIELEVADDTLDA